MIKVFESFAGIGTQRMALRNLGIEHEATAIAEVDEYALLSYHAIHTADIEVKEASEEEMQRYMEEKNIPLDPKGKRKILKNKRLKDLYVASIASNNLGDISKITDDEIPKVDLFTYSFPCQDISLAGKQKGLDKNSGTRSSLLWECEKIIETVKPKYLLMENVKALVNKNNKPQFDIWLEYLEELGYKNFWKILNAKDYGIPQNRERVFVVSILDENADYKFPDEITLTLKLKDILEDNVDDSYYLSQEQVDRITFSTYNIAKTRIQEKEYSDTLCARDYKDPKCVKVRQIGQYDTPTRKNSNRYRVYDVENISPSLTTMGGGNLEPHVIGGIGEKNFGKQYRQGNRVYESEGVAACLQAAPVGGTGGQSSLYKVKQIGQYDTPILDNDDLEDYELVGTIYSNASKRFIGKPMKGLSKTLKATTPDTAVVYKKNNNENCTDNYRVRKLTPLECWRLMGISDEDFEKASKVVSNSQLYKQAGNAIVVDVLEGIFKQLFNTDENNGGKE